MKKLILFILISTITACSPKENQAPEVPEVIKVENAAVLENTGDSPDYGSFEATDAALTRIFKITNNGDASTSEVVSASIVGDPAFKILLQQGCSTVLAKTKTCTVRVSFDPKNKQPNTYSATLRLGAIPSFELPLTALVEAPQGGTTGGTSGGSTGGTATGPYALVRFLDGTTEVSSLDMGDFSGTQSLQKIITIKNNGTTSLPTTSAVISNSTEFSVLNQCNNKTLAAGASCNVRLTFSASGKAVGVYNNTVTFGSAVLNVSAEVVAAGGGSTSGGSTTGAGSVQIAFLEGTTPVVSPLNMGSFSGTQSLQKIITIKNNGTASSGILSAALSNTTQFAFLNQCSNKNLAPNGTCSVRVTFSASGKTPGSYSTVLSFGTASLNIDATVAGLACSPGQHLENNVCEDDVQVCPISNGSGTKTWNGSSYGPCLVASCNSGYEMASNQCIASCPAGKHREGAFCVNDTRACPIANGVGTQSWSAGVWSSCAVVSCNATYHINGNACEANDVACSVGELPNNASSGIKSWNGTAYGSCVATACNSTFDLYQGGCYAALEVSPSSATVNSGEVLNLNVSGGVAPYIYEIDPATTIGSMVEASSGNNALGIYTAGTNSGSSNASETIKITDQRGISVISSIQIPPSNVNLPLSLDGDGAVLSYGLTYNFNATGGTPPYVYTVNSFIGSVVDPNTGEFTPGDNQQIDLVTDLLRVTDNTGAFVEIRLNISNNIQVMYPALYDSNTGQYVSNYSDNDQYVSITIRNAPSDKYIRVYADSTCSGSQIYEGYSYGGDIGVNDSIWESYDTSRTYSVSEEDVDPETQQPTYSNVICSSYTVTYNYDNTPPQIYSISAQPAGGNLVNISVGVSDARSVNFYKDLNCTESIGGMYDAYGTFQYDVGSSPGVYFFTFTAEDSAGNTTECSNGGMDQTSITMNYYAIYEHLLGDAGLFPIVSGNTVEDGVAYYNQPYIPVYVYGNSIEYDYADLFFDSTCSTTPVAQATNTGNSPYNTYISGAFVSGDIYNDENQNPISDGTYQVYARRGLDQTYNYCSISSIPIVIDTQAPAPINLSLVQGTYNNTGNIEFNFDGIESNVSFVLGRNCQNSSYGFIPFNDRIAEQSNYSSSTYSYNLVNGGGFYRFAVSVRDRAGNFSQCSNIITYEYDNGRPYITEISSSTPDGVYGIGQNINIRLTFNKPIQKLNNSGFLSVKVSNSISRNIPFSNAIVSGNHLDFTYTVISGDNTGTGKISIEGFNNSGAIADASNSSLYANTKIPDAGINKRLEEDHSLKADGVGPTSGSAVFALTNGFSNYSNSLQESAPVNITVTGSDQGGGTIAGYEIAIGSSTSNRTNVLNWTNVGSGTSNLKATGLNLSTGTIYYLSLRSYDNFGNKSDFFSLGANNYGMFIVDIVPPLGKIAFVDDREFGTSTTQTMSINFAAAINSGGVEAPDVAKYQVAIGVEPGGTSILGWSDVSNHNLVSMYDNTANKRYKVQVTGINLNANTIYYATIRYCDLANNCKEAYGNGFTLKNSDGFNQKNYLKSSNKIANGRYGAAVAVEGNYVVVGAPGEGVGGRVYVYKRVAGTNQLIEEAVLTAANAEAGDEFGAAVAISGNRIIVGAPAEDGPSNNLSNSGAAYVFKKGTSWTQESVLRAHNPGVDDRFGDRVKISQLYAAVSALYEDSDYPGATSNFGAISDNNNLTNSGAVYTFAVDNSTQLWAQDGYIKKTNSANCNGGNSQCPESANDNFGFALDLKGPVLAIGVPNEDQALIGFQHRYIDRGGGVGAGSSANRSAYPQSGAVYIFHRQYTSWQVAYNIRSPNIDPGDEFGYSVAINEVDSVSSNFSTLPTHIPNYMIAVGAPGEDYGSFISSLHQETFQATGLGDGTTSRRFTTNSNNLPVTGSSGSTGTYLNNSVTDSGAVYVYVYDPIWEGQNLSLANGGSLPLAMHLYSYLKAPNLGAGDRFGSSLGFVGNATFGWDRTTNPPAPTSIQRAVSYLVVGAPKEDNSATGVQLWFSSNNIWNGSSPFTDNNSATDSGAVYVFKHGYENLLQTPANQKTDFVLQQYIKPPVSKPGDEFGSQISASVNSWIIGVSLDDADANSSQSSSGSADTSLSNSGAAYLINSLD